MRTVLGRYVADTPSGVSAAAEYDGWVYVSPDDGRGTVWRTVDGMAYEEFWRTGEPRVTSIGGWADALFVGTGPRGRIWMHNFSTGNRFEVAVTGDYEVTAILPLADRVLAGTGPSGAVLGFDGDRWTKEYEAFFDISAMAEYQSKVFVFFRDSPSILCGTGRGHWAFMQDAGKPFSVASVMPAKTVLEQLASGRQEETGISAAATCSGKLFFSGATLPTLYAYDGTAVTVARTFAAGPVASMSAGTGQLFVSVGDTVYVHEELLQASSGA